MKAHIENLFQFLKHFQKLKTRPIFNVESYEKVLWFYDIPKEKECFSITQKIASEKCNKDFDNFNKWIALKKPKRDLCPAPPKEIMPWLKDEDLENSETIPELLKHIINPDNSVNEGDNKMFLEDYPEIQKIFENYLNQKWTPWAKEQNRLKPIVKIYNCLYEMYKKNETWGEVYQVILGLGLLSAKNDHGKDIKRHIATTPLSIDFDSVTGTITIGPYKEQDVEFSLEMDMLKENEKPRNCDEISSKLSDFSNNFWQEESFYDNLKSWLNSYDSNGQFIKHFEKPEIGHYTTLHVCPAIILRKRNQREFLKFYNSVIEDVKTPERELSLNSELPCLRDLVGEQKDSSSFTEKNGIENVKLSEKYYFPLPANEEQGKIIGNIAYANQVVVQGPPGTGKTHSIANLICHFLSKGQRILVTSQTVRALKVLKNKLPEDIKPLCVEILGRDQKSFQALKESFEIINSKKVDFDTENNLKEIDRLEKKDDELQGRLAAIKSRLFDIQRSETKRFEKLFGFWTGTSAVIARCVREEEEKFKWIKEFFNSQDYNKKCPISNNEARDFFSLIKKNKDIDDSILEESMEYENSIFSLQDFKKKVKKEIEIKGFLEKYKNSINLERLENYKNMKNEDLILLKQHLKNLYLDIENLLNRDEKWVKQALSECLADKDRDWRYLYEETNKILNENQNTVKKIEKINIGIDRALFPKSTPMDVDLTNLLQEFFEKYEKTNKINWGWFAPKIVQKLKKIKIDGKPISSYEDVKKFQTYVDVKKDFEKLNKCWAHQGIDTKNTQNQNFGRNYHIFKDYCEPLSNCLLVHESVEGVNQIYFSNNISQPLWNPDSVKKEIDTAEFSIAQKTLEILMADFERILSSLKPYTNQKNGIAKKFILAINSRSFEEYQKAFDQMNDFKNRKKDFDELCYIKENLNDQFYLQLKKEIDNPLWEKRLQSFEKAWAWQRADLWVKEQISEESFQSLSEEKKNLLEAQKQNMESLVSHKAWDSCLSQITHDEVSSLRALIQSISKIGKGLGKSAGKHRRAAKERMEECKTAIPAWIMPLYRVVENIKPNTKKLFDIAIIDEASQTGPDGFLITYLAKKVIVVGDKEQISPDNVGIREEDVEALKKKWLSGIKRSEYIGRDYSYYDYCEILFTKSHVQLKEHFRCMPEIIQFSNQISYTGTPLIPLRQYGSSRLAPLKSTFVPFAISKIGNSNSPQNKREAQAIVEQIQKCIKDPKYKGKTFGIISLQGKAQVKVIEQELELIDKVEMEKRAIQVGDAYDFQGDERDVIFLSMGIAKDWQGRALTKESEKRRYNVAASRAKDQMHLFHSIDINDLPNKEGYRRKLLNHFLKKPEDMTGWPMAKLNELYKKIKETNNKSPENAPRPFGSWFEARVFHKISMKNYQVVPQNKVSGYSIDMIVVGSKGRLAVECDGDYWHPKEKEGEDLERQWQLERCGWTFWRLRESAFNRNEDEALKSLWDKLEEMQIFPLGDNDPSSNGSAA